MPNNPSKPRRQVVGEFIKDRLAAAGLELRRNPFIDPLQLQVRLISSDTPVIFDVGAHIGLTVDAYRQVFPSATIHAFEPFPDSFSRLEARVGQQAGTHLHPLAMSDQDGSKTLFVNQSEATNSLKPLSDLASDNWGEGRLTPSEQINITCETLDNFCTRNKIEQIDIIKIDVQGAEHEVLQGARQMLGKHAIKLIQFECILAETYAGQRPMHEYLALMDKLGYRFLDFFQPMRRNGRLLQADLMFASPEIRVS